jgi:glycerol kinase
MLMKNYVLSIDQGTSSSRAIIFDTHGQVIHMEQSSFKQHYPQPGWVEHDAMEILNTQIKVIEACLQHVGRDSIDSIGITNQRETTVVWNKRTGVPYGNAIVWQDRRTASRCEALKDLGWESYIHDATGLVLDAYFSATKIEWILNHHPQIKQDLEKKEVLVGTIDTWLVWNLTGGKIHATDYSNASRTMLFNIREGKWDIKLLQLFQIPEDILPIVKNSSDDYGVVSDQFSFKNIPIRSVIGDQQAALFGHLCLQPGSSKNTYGTGCFMLFNTGSEPTFSNNGLLTTIAWSLNGHITYAMEGAVFNAGSAVQWLRDGLQIIEKSSDTDEAIAKTNNNGDVYMVPAFTGLGAPHWDMYARGTIVGLTRGSTKNHIIRATMESIAYQCYDILGLMQEETHLEITSLNVDGGLTNSHFLMQFQADLLNRVVVKNDLAEMTALGAAYLAGLHSGFYSIEQLKALQTASKNYTPSMSDIERTKLLHRWNAALQRAKGWSLSEMD